MDSTAIAIGIASVLVGYWFRGLQIPDRVDPPACNCVCRVEPVGVGTQSGASGFPYVACGLAFLAILVALLSNAALVLKVSLKDSKGTDRELQINVKGKSKGIYGSGRGLSITG